MDGERCPAGGISRYWRSLPRSGIVETNELKISRGRGSARMKWNAIRPDPIDSISQSLFGIGSLAKELQRQGVPASHLFDSSGVDLGQLNDANARISRRQRLQIYRNAERLAVSPDMGLRAGAHQRLADYGVYGYALASCSSVSDAVVFSLRHLRLACPVLEIRYREGPEGLVLSSHGSDEVGDLLPFVAEYWRSSMVTLMSRCIEQPFRSERMLFPYPAPRHWRSYLSAFKCPVEFEAGALEWHIRRDDLIRPFANANPANATAFDILCSKMAVASAEDRSTASRIKQHVMMGAESLNGAEMAKRLGTSARSMFRRLAEEGLSYQTVVDEARRELALRQLHDRSVLVKNIAQELGFSETTNFCKAFKRWTGMTPGRYRAVHG